MDPADTTRRLLFLHEYSVGFAPRLQALKQELILKARGVAVAESKTE